MAALALTESHREALTKLSQTQPVLSAALVGPDGDVDLGALLGALVDALGPAADDEVPLTVSAAELNILDCATVLAADINVDDGASETETILVAGAVSIEKGETLLNAASGAYAVTLAAPAASARPIRKVIRMSVAGAAITMSLANCIGGTAATTASFDAINEALVLISVGTKWMIVGQAGVTLS